MIAIVKKRALIWNYFIIDQKEKKIAICNDCQEHVSQGGSTVKKLNSTNLRNDLHHFHHKLFDELIVKEHEDTKKKVEESKVIKQSKLSEPYQLMLIELKEQKEQWNYSHPEHIKATK